jgi:hypothetical protein
MLSPDFLYIIPLRNDDLASATPYQGFTLGILESPKFIQKILGCPAHLMELCADRARLIAFRMCAGASYHVLPIDKALLSRISIPDETPFVCVFSDKGTYSETMAFIEGAAHPILHVSVLETKTALHLDKLRRDDFVEYVKRVVQHLTPTLSRPELLTVNTLLDKMAPQGEVRIPLKRRFHFITLPNEATLTSLGYSLDDGEQLIGYDDAPYVQAIIESTDAVNNERRRTLESEDTILPFPLGLDLIVTSPAIYKHLYRFAYDNAQYKENLDYRLFTKIHQLIKRQTGYSLKSDTTEMAEIFSSPVGQSIFQLRKEEALSYTSAVSVKAASNFCPTIRLPPAINTLHPELKKLADCVRSPNYSNKAYKVNRLCRQITDRLLQIVDPALMKRIDVENGDIKLITDAPLEWLPIRGLPLVLRCDVSRIPATPGNLFFQQCLFCDQTIVPVQAFEEVLVVRSFEQTDPIRDTLKHATDVIRQLHDLAPLIEAHEAGGAKNAGLAEALRHSVATNQSNPVPFSVKLRWADVSNADEFISALNAFDGGVLIYDGHGISGTDTAIGSLKIGDSKLDTWELRGKARIPPIVLLSACDTHSIDASHASVANGFLAAGAMTVLGTLLPIDAERAADFIARMILRLEQFLPVVAKRRSMRWTHMVSGLQRMSFISESLIILSRRARLQISPDAYMRIHTAANTSINQRRATWYEEYLDLLSQETRTSSNALKQAIDTWVRIPECIKYVQLGNPELILIAGNDIAPLIQAQETERLRVTS